MSDLFLGGHNTMIDTSKSGLKYDKYAGILVHPTSFPGPYGIGDLGEGAYNFIDFMEKSGLNLWQVLPLGHTGFGNSPYQPFSSFAGQPLVISVDELREVGLLYEEDFVEMPQWNPIQVEYGKVIAFKENLFKKAFARFKNPEIKDGYSQNEQFIMEYKDFCKKSEWLMDYSLFMAGKDYHEGAPWYEWEDSLKNPTSKQKKEWTRKLESQMEYYCFMQFIFHKQWFALKEYANKKNIKIVGDIPIFVALDSADVWSNKKLFDLNEKGYPNNVAGVPPDYFSETGQLWGNPLYNWGEHTKTGYEWWFQRIRHQLKLADFLRIDHFRGFDKFWAIPYGEETAINGKWIEAPGVNFFTNLEATLGYNMPIIAEDLGEIDQSVIDLRDKFGLPGMKILQFGFENPEENSFLPHNFVRNCVCYTGTHDNDTTLGWYQKCYESSKDKLRRYFNTDGGDVCWTLIRACFSSVANMAVVPMQDILYKDSSARMNTPGVKDGNWGWRFKQEELTPHLEARLYETAKLYGR